MSKDTNLHFYQGDQLHTALGSSSSRTLMRNQNQLLAEQERQAGKDSAKLLASDSQSSVLQAKAGEDSASFSYTPFGFSPSENVTDTLAGFNGETRDPRTGCYLLGNGYRAFSPVTMRFDSPDSYSPFGEGGINTYMYCAGDPINRNDPTGHMFRPWVTPPRRNSITTPPPQNPVMRTSRTTPHRHDPIAQAGRPRQPGAGVSATIANAPQAAAVPVPVAGPSTRNAMPSTHENDAPRDLRSAYTRVNQGHHKSDHPEYRAFIEDSIQQLAQLRKTMQPMDAIRTFTGGLPDKLSDKAYNEIRQKSLNRLNKKK